MGEASVMGFRMHHLFWKIDLQDDWCCGPWGRFFFDKVIRYTFFRDLNVERPKTAERHVDDDRSISRR